jgi:cytochrome P450
MLLFPRVQIKAHEELDRVIGRDRLPDFSDQGQLPYTKAICLELLRWRPIAPPGIPHRSIADDEYRGMFIPKGSLVIGNVWYVSLFGHAMYVPHLDIHRPMLRDEIAYGPNPGDFNPDRFLKDDAHVPTAAFGFGRR